MALSSLLILVLLYAAYRTMDAIVARWAHRFGFSDIADVASLPLLLLVTSVFSLAIAPAQLAFTRHAEHEADRSGSRSRRRITVPGRPSSSCRRTHSAILGRGRCSSCGARTPPLGERIEFSNDYHPWREARRCATPTHSGMTPDVDRDRCCPRPDRAVPR